MANTYYVTYNYIYMKRCPLSFKKNIANLFWIKKLYTHLYREKIINRKILRVPEYQQ